MGQVTLYAHAAGDWDVADAWNDAANGSGTHYTNPQNGTPANTTYICVLNSLAMHANVDITVDAIQAPASDIGTLTIEGTRVINVGSSNGIVYGHTLTTGMIVVPTGTNLTINGQVVNSAAGYAVVTAGTAVLAVSNVGGTAVACTAGAGRTIYHAATGSLTITGIVDSSTTASGYAIYCDSAAVISITGNVTHSDATTTHYGIYTVTGNNTLTIDGTVVSSGGGFALYLRSGTATINHDISSSHTGVALAGALYVNGATVTLLGDIVDSASWATVYIASGTLNWYGAHTVAASKNACIWLRGGILNFVLQGNPFTPLVLTNNGSFVLIKTGGTLNTADAGAGAAQINNQTAPSPTAGAYAAMIGCTDAQKAIITGPTLPAENVVKDGESFGYPGDPQEGTYDQYPNIIWPSESNVTTDEPNYGPTGVDYHGEIDMSTYTLIAGVVDAEFVIVGHDNYTDGDAGEYPTTATSQAAQLATDQGVVLAAAASIKDDVSILDQAGTYDFTAAIAAGFTAGQADQYATDQAEVTAKAAALSDTETICEIAGSLDLGLYTLIATVLSPDDALLGVDRYDSDPTPGTCRLPVEAKVEDEYAYGPSDTLIGEYSPGGTYTEGQLAQLATDQAEVNTHLADIWNGETVLTGADPGTMHASDIPNCVAGVIKDGESVDDVNGTYSPGGTFAEGQADQHATDQAEVTAKADHLSDTETICAIAGTLDLDLYTLIATVLSPDDALLGVDRYDSDPTPGNCRLPAEAKVEDGYFYGPSDTLEGSLAGGGGVYKRVPRLTGV